MPVLNEKDVIIRLISSKEYRTGKPKQKVILRNSEKLHNISLMITRALLYHLKAQQLKWLPAIPKHYNTIVLTADKLTQRSVPRS